MKEGLLQLLKLQEVDKRLFALKEAKEKYPTEIDIHRREIAKARYALSKLEAEIEDLEKEQRLCEREIESGKATLREREGRFPLVKTNKEYDALQTEIDICKKAIAKHEADLIKTIGELKEKQEEIAAAQEAFEEVRKPEQERIDEIEGQLATIHEQIEEVAATRQIVAKSVEDIDAKLLRTYESKKGRRGIRVAAVRREACGACFYQMPAQTLNEVRSSNRVITCEICGAIMVWNE